MYEKFMGGVLLEDFAKVATRLDANKIFVIASFDRKIYCQHTVN